jgi:hypothetical protein
VSVCIPERGQEVFQKHVRPRVIRQGARTTIGEIGDFLHQSSAVRRNGSSHHLGSWPDTASRRSTPRVYEWPRLAETHGSGYSGGKITQRPCSPSKDGMQDLCGAVLAYQSSHRISGIDPRCPVSRRSGTDQVGNQSSIVTYWKCTKSVHRKLAFALCDLQVRVFSARKRGGLTAPPTVTLCLLIHARCKRPIKTHSKPGRTRHPLEAYCPSSARRKSRVRGGVQCSVRHRLRWWKYLRPLVIIEGRLVPPNPATTISPNRA